MENFGKTAVFPRGYAGFGKYSMGGYGRIGVYMVKNCRNSREYVSVVGIL